ncbi:hypothetical protein [Fodinibius salsisoli]|uniref:DUF2059 domain-containing protein n=1 Tax=Fodinibius salsisoli TaxID=2820877 RepID=A0ABT3PK60_9BACT|nr:hypothetical protein [Fodinibius salsisoli]MCW9706133.1 hypothetical protein [Fodinibius salsisoli]
MNLPFRSVCSSIALLLFCIPLVGQAQSPTENTQALTDTITTKFAIADKIQEAPQDLYLQFEQNPLNLSPEKNEEILTHFSEAYKTNLLVDDFKTALQKKLIGEFVDAVSQQLGTQAFQSVTQAQQEFYTLQGKRKRIVTKYELEKDPPSAGRTSLIQTLVDTTSLASESIESSIIILRPLLTALMKESQQRTFSEAQLDAITSNFRAQMQSQASEQTLNDLLITFYNIDNKTLNEYLSFMQSPSGQWLDQTISASIQEAYQQASDRFSASVNSDQ